LSIVRKERLSMDDLAPHLRALLTACLPTEEAERRLHEFGRGLRGGVPVRRTVRYRLDDVTGKTVAVEPAARRRGRR
jgi:hypothetical protein